MNYTCGRPKVLGLTLSFFAGMVLTLGVWLVFSREEVAQMAPLSSESLPPPRSSSTTSNAMVQASILNAPLGEPTDNGFQEGSAVVDTNEFGRLLSALLDSPEEEREARLGILLGTLRRSGIAGVHWIEEYLKMAADLSNESLYGPQITKWLSLPSFRELLGVVLIQVAEREPSLAQEITRIGLASARTVSEAVDFIRLGEGTAPGVHRDAILPLVQRLLAEKDESFDTLNAAIIMAHFRAEELLPALEAALETQPYLGLSEFFEALWRLPDETRIEATQRLLAREKVGEALSYNPHMAIQIDTRIPEFRSAIATFFAAAKGEDQRMSLLRQLGDTRPTRMNPLVPGALMPEFRPGEPGSREQALGRLSLLGELAPCCDTPLLQEHLNQARRELEKVVSK